MKERPKRPGSGLLSGETFTLDGDQVRFHEGVILHNPFVFSLMAGFVLQKAVCLTRVRFSQSNMCRPEKAGLRQSMRLSPPYQSDLVTDRVGLKPSDPFRIYSQNGFAEEVSEDGGRGLRGRRTPEPAEVVQPDWRAEFQFDRGGVIQISERLLRNWPLGRGCAGQLDNGKKTDARSGRRANERNY